MKIETDGSLPAEDAVAYAARIFQDQLSLFVNFDEPAEVEKKPKTGRRVKKKTKFRTVGTTLQNLPFDTLSKINSTE